MSCKNATVASSPAQPRAKMREKSPLTRGRRLLIVGGDRRQHHVRRLVAELGLSAVTWCSTRDSDPTSDRFRDLILGDAFDIVVALVGLLRHQHFADIRRLCGEAGISPIVLNRSPNPTRLLHAMAATDARSSQAL